MDISATDMDDNIQLATITTENGRLNGLASFDLALETAVLAASTRVKYRRVVIAFLDAGGMLTQAGDLAEFADTLSPSRRAQLKAAVKLWSERMIDQVKATPAGGPDDVLMKQEAIWRFQSLQTAVTVQAAKGEKAHTWLTRPEVQQLMDAAGGDSVGAHRDRLAMGLLVSAGLRRDEAVTLSFSDVKLQPIKGKIRSVLQVEGKGAKSRVVPVSGKLAWLVDKWAGLAGGNGRVLRSVDKTGAIGDELSAVALFQIVRRYGETIGKPGLAPHDLRRTYAQIGYESGVSITQISKLLGHSSVTTTQRYLNLDLDLETTISDFVPV